MTKPIKVKVVYRNYRPLHSMFSTFIDCPVNGVNFEIPQPRAQKKLFSILYKIYNKFGDNLALRWFLAKVIDPIIFGASSKDDSVDIYHFLNLIPSRKMNKPFVVEFEHVGALYGFGYDGKQIDRVKRTLMDKYCSAIICSTQAAKRTLEQLMGDKYGSVSSKVEVIYPSVCKNHIYYHQSKKAKNTKLKLLFVGNLCYLKGLEELLDALQNISGANQKVSLSIISNDAEPLINKYPGLSESIDYHLPNFSKTEIIDKFYSKADLFILPTKRDTFGFALVDALTCGLPVISTNQFAIPEIIDNQKDGIILNLKKPVLDNTLYITRALAESTTKPNADKELTAQIKRCIEDILAGKYNLESFQKAAYKKVEPGGKFSAKVRNQCLQEIYKNALS